MRLTSSATRREAGPDRNLAGERPNQELDEAAVEGYRTVGSDIEHVDWIGFWLAATARNECLRSLARRKSEWSWLARTYSTALPCVSQIPDELRLPVGVIGPARGRSLTQLRVLLETS
jgi:hypothetical protein